MAHFISIDDDEWAEIEADRLDMAKAGHIGQSYERCDCKRCEKLIAEAEKHKKLGFGGKKFNLTISPGNWSPKGMIYGK